MLHVIGLILKITGILLLAILGLLLLIILTALLVPIRYRVRAEHGDELLKVEGKANWLLHLINARFSHLEGVFHVRVRILWFILYDNLRPKKSKKLKTSNKNSKAKKTAKNNMKAGSNNKPDKTKISKTQNPVSSTTKIKDGNSKTDIIKPKANQIAETVQQKDKTLPSLKISETKQMVEKVEEVEKVVIDKAMEEKGIEEKVTEDKVNIEKVNIEKVMKEKASEKETEKKKFILYRILDKIRSIKEKIQTSIKELKEKIIGWFSTAANMKHKASLVLDFIKDEINREGFQVTYSSLKRLLKHILPARLQSRIIFGTGDPCSTGQALGATSILYSFYGDKVQIVPDFENKRLEGKHYARGRIRLATILIIVIKLILDKRFKQLKGNFQILKEAL